MRLNRRLTCNEMQVLNRYGDIHFRTQCIRVVVTRPYRQRTGVHTRQGGVSASGLRHNAAP